MSHVIDVRRRRPRRLTAAMLTRAMGPGVTEEVLSGLDDRFYAVPEDLAVLTMRHFQKLPERNDPQRKEPPGVDSLGRR